MTIDTRALVGDAVDDLAEGIRPFIERVFLERYPDGPTWVQVLAHEDELAGRPTQQHHPNDVLLMLRAITERLGDLGYPFDGCLSRQAVNLASELCDVRNRHAHQVAFTPAETYRALDSAELLLRAVGADSEAVRVAARKPRVLAALGDRSSSKPLPQPPAGPLPTPPAVVSNVSAVEAFEASRAQLSIVAVTELSYAMAHARIMPVQEVRIAYDGGELRGASLEIEASCAGGSLGRPKVVILDLAPGTKILTGLDLLTLDPSAMLRVDTEQPGVISLILRNPDGVVLGEHRHSVVVLAANQWIARELHLGLELLASFVQPQAEALTAVLQSASDLLGERTGRTALDGYQSDDPARVDAMAEAIWDAVRLRDVRYAEPPASWGTHGQKVRAPQEVLDDRLGTCLDTSVTLAALFEQVGINSTLWLTDGHILVGYWREDGSLGLPATTDIEEVVNLAELGRIRLIETTRVTGGSASATFEHACAAARSYLEQCRGEVLGVTDIRGARENRILPLPNRSAGADGSMVVVEYTAPERVIAPFVAEEREHRGRSPVPLRIMQWKNALLDLSLRNRLIHFTDRAGYQLAVPGQALARFEDMINAGAGVTLLASDDVPQIARERGIRFGRDRDAHDREALLADRRQVHLSDVTQVAYTTRLRALVSKAKTVTEETGANNLYLAFGTLRWEFNGRQLQSPLILVPVILESVSRGQSFRLTLDEAGASTPNYCLLEKLKVSFGIDIPGLANPRVDAAGIDLAAAFAAVRQAMIDAKRPFVVEETVHMAILQFAKFRLWKDLDENWEELTANPLVTHLVHTPNDAFMDAVPAPADVDLDALNTQVPVAADSSQLDAVVEAVAGRTFVLEGPPGTGKSQTITNLLARALAAGKRVLFVAEKRAALDVVKDRLDAVGLGAFSLDLHDKGARPNAVREQLRAALEATARPDLPALSAQREASEASRTALSRYAERLHEPNLAGYSLYSARSHELAADADIAALPVPPALVASASVNVFDELRTCLRGLPAVSDLARPSAVHPWGFVDGEIETAGAHDAARAFDTALAAVSDRAMLVGVRRPEQLDAWAGVARAPRYPIEALDALASPAAHAVIERLKRDVEALIAARPGWLAQVDVRVLGRDVREIHAAAVAADESSFFGRKKRRLAVLERFSVDLASGMASVRPRDLSALTGAITETAERVAALTADLARLPITVVPPGWNPFLPSGADEVIGALSWLNWLSPTLSEASSAAGDLRPELRRFYATTGPDAASAEQVATLAAAWRALAATCRTGAPDGSDADRFMAWARATNVSTAWEQTRAARNLATTEPVTLSRWLDLIRHVEILRRHGLHEAREAILTGRAGAADASLAFDKGLAVASVHERADATALSDFDPGAHNRTIDRFARSSAAIRNELPRAIPADILEQRRFNPNYDGGDMGALKRQLARQRGGDSVRALMEKYGELITQITPCMLMSPESVARFFPARAGTFDIVVFDEASQIRVADAVGAMGRARSVVVVGDSKQMPPSTFAEVTADIDAVVADVGVVADEESILTECTQARVPSKWLSWHYRSQDEALISFSNHQYYESRLSSFPAPMREFSASSRAEPPATELLKKPDYGISLVRVDGQFVRSARAGTLRTNRVEAQAIVDEVARRFAETGDRAPSIGIITFNVQQRDLIENMLRDAADESIGRAMDERDGLFVKNLESVQGDERDTILFSVAFSKNERGVLPLNFGPLSRAGGERRLNVAVTRARRQVILYASFDPTELRAEQTSARGIKHLKTYLELAEHGVEPTEDSTRRVAVVDRHRDDIAAALRVRGLVVKTDVGLSDFRVDLSLASPSDPALPLVAVLLDGDRWRARRTVADRDGLPVDVLGGLMRWPGVERVWLPEWLDDREATVERLLTAVETAAERSADASTAVATTRVPAASAAGVGTGPDVAGVRLTADGLLVHGVPAVETELRAEHDVEKVQAIADADADEALAHAPGHGIRHPNLEIFVPWTPSPRGGIDVLDALPNSWASQRVRDALIAAVEHEGPVSHARLVRLVAESFGLSRVSGARSSTILRQLPAEHTRDGDTEFAWPATTDPVSWRRARTRSTSESRPLEHVSLEEIANAMAVVAQLGGGMRDEEIKREALAIFGGRRLTQQISARLDAALQLALRTRRIEVSPSGAFIAVADA